MAAALIPPAAFVDTRWRIVYSAACELRNAGTPVCAESISDFIACSDLDKEFQHAIDSTKTFDWHHWPEHADQSLAFSPSSLPLEYCLSELGYLYSKRQAAQIATRLQEGTLELHTAITSLQQFIPQTNGNILRPLLTFGDTGPDPGSTLLGNRFLCREGGMLFVGPSGIGKTAASVQQDLLWSIGLRAFGIAPTHPLKILTIYAEDDEGDLSEIVSGILSNLNLSADQLSLCRRNCLYVSEKSMTSIPFLEKVVAPLLIKVRPDLLRINPLQAYLGGDIKDTQLSAAFLRNTLNPLLVTYQLACILVHHTPKTNFRDTTEWKASDWMYAGAGAADITNWARAALVIDPTEDPHVFRFIAAKRGSRIGWASDNGDSVTIRHFSHSTSSSIYWRDTESNAIPEKKSGSKAKFAREQVKEIMSGVVAMKQADILRQAMAKHHMSLRTAKNLFAELKELDEIESEAKGKAARWTIKT